VSTETIFSLFMWFVPTLLSLTVHEWAHAMGARSLGDDTAERMGRLTLNPISHVDLLGTVILPVVQVLTAGYVVIAWAKPVPYNPLRFRRDVSMSTGTAIVAAAGPGSNLAIATLAAVGYGLCWRFGIDSAAGLLLLKSLVFINIGLAVFNLLPIPPLDGSKVLWGLLPRRAALEYERIFPYAPVLLFGLLLFGPRLGVLQYPIAIIGSGMDWVVRLVAG
jgi:Zn-dependent protease